jgi:hypothetical protein
LRFAPENLSEQRRCAHSMGGDTLDMSKARTV